MPALLLEAEPEDLAAGSGTGPLDDRHAEARSADDDAWEAPPSGVGADDDPEVTPFMGPVAHPDRELPLATRVVGAWIGASAGLVLVCCGLVLVAMAVLVPAWQSQQRSAWELGVVRRQAEALSEQVHRYERFYMAVLRDDPDVLERLALSQMRLAPDGREVIGMAYLDSTPAGDIDRWLRVPVPQVGRDLPPWFAADSRLTRITRGPLRVGLLIAGASVVLAGFSWRVSPHR